MFRPLLASGAKRAGTSHVCARNDYGKAGSFSVERLRMDLPFVNVLCARTSTQRSAAPRQRRPCGAVLWAMAGLAGAPDTTATEQRRLRATHTGAGPHRPFSRARDRLRVPGRGNPVRPRAFAGTLRSALHLIVFCMFPMHELCILVAALHLIVFCMFPMHELCILVAALHLIVFCTFPMHELCMLVAAKHSVDCDTSVIQRWQRPPQTRSPSVFTQQPTASLAAH